MGRGLRCRHRQIVREIRARGFTPRKDWGRAIAAHFWKRGVIPNARVFFSGRRDLAQQQLQPARDPSLRLNDGSARDDALGTNVHNYRLTTALV